MSAQRGFTYLEIIFTLAIVGIVTLAGGAMLTSSKPYTVHGAALSFDALLGHARTIAATSGNGATIAIVNDMSGFTATIYSGRPNAAGIGTAVQTLHGDATATSAFTSATSYAFFLNSAGNGTAAIWTASSGTIATEPTCPGALDMTFTSGAHVETRALACTDMRLR